MFTFNTNMIHHYPSHQRQQIQNGLQYTVVPSWRGAGSKSPKQAGQKLAPSQQIVTRLINNSSCLVKMLNETEIWEFLLNSGCRFLCGL